MVTAEYQRCVMVTAEYQRCVMVTAAYERHVVVTAGRKKTFSTGRCDSKCHVSGEGSEIASVPCFEITPY